ncbi:unnamed protein product [Prunus armeniaca]|uniref:Uncharacterized protein n=1 Tax=Prunus armeniaca TaxID=36596 RepID=A0A6J5VUN8_PRUAR|nr:unnamed protein product [Prunus armeniaca]
MSINPLGYSPVLHRPNFIGSPQALSQAAQMYNVQLKIQLDALKRSMLDFNFALVNTYNIMTNIIQNPASTGFEDTSNPCCKVTSQIQVVIVYINLVFAIAFHQNLQWKWPCDQL